MKNRIANISVLQISILTFFLTRSLFFIGGSSLMFQMSKTDTIVCLILGTIIGLIPLILYLKISSIDENKSIIEKLDTYFPPFFAYVFKLLLLFGIFFLSIYCINHLSDYINYNLLPDMKPSIIKISLLLLVFYTVYKGLETILRSSSIILFLFVFLFLITILGLIPYVDADNIKPLFSHSITTIVKGSLTYAALSSLPLMLLTMIKKDKISSHEHYNKFIIISYLLGSFSILISFITILGSLGENLTTLYQYPEMIILRKISFLDFIERVESTLSIEWLFDSFLLLSMLIYTIKKGILSFNRNQNKKQVRIEMALLFTLLFIISNLFIMNEIFFLTFLGATCLAIPLLLFLQLKLAAKPRRNL